ncbi:putative oxidoreductase TDA3 [Magnolia sinica]|uniref:putative oxidoreductase TDA3 n=1 Tax=Magnolia sinica TaxID=86752 RepID=UPI0026582661|nr:putative oxidoreductase TDA3 [Magnolia sinica]
MSLSSSSSPSMPAAAEPQLKRVVVCGGGVIGICTAFFLAKKAAASVSITVVEKSSVACAASGKAGGFLALDWCDGGPLSELARTSFNLHRSLSAELDGPTAYGYRPLRTLSLSLSASTSPSSTRKPAHIIPDWVDGPVRNASTIGTVETTAQVHPQLFTRTLMAEAKAKHGVEVVTGEVERVEVEGGRATAVVLKEEGGRPAVLPADAVVLALGPWSCRLVVISSLFRVSGLKAHSIVLKPRNPDAITPDALFLNYHPSHGGKALDPEVYPRPTGEVYLCGMSKDAKVPDDPEQIEGDEESIRMLHKIAGEVSSHLGEGEVEVRAEQACFLPCTDDGRPVIGEMPDIKGCYVATGHSCWGILNGPATGAAMAELVLDGQASTLDLSPFSPARFLSGSRRRQHA